MNQCFLLSGNFYFWHHHQAFCTFFVFLYPFTKPSNEKYTCSKIHYFFTELWFKNIFQRLKCWSLFLFRVLEFKISHFTTSKCQFHQHLTNSSIFSVYCCTFLSEWNWKNLKKLVKLVANVNYTNILLTAVVLQFSFALFCQNKIGRI